MSSPAQTPGRRPAPSSPVVTEWRTPTVRPDRPRLLLGVLLLAAAMPVRFPVHTPVFTSVSVLDVVLLVVAVTLVLDLPFHRLDLGYRTIFVVLAVPAVAIVLSLAWSQDRAATLAVAGFTLESVVVYLFVTRELEGLSSERIVALLERFVVLLIVPAVLLLLHVPGFQPEQPGLSPSSGDYLGYYTRLSHPVLGRSNNLATVLVVFVPVLLWWGHTRRKRAAAFVGFLGLAAVIATQSRGVVLASVVALGIFALVRPPQRIRGRPFFGKVFGATVVLALAGVVFYELNPLTRELGASRFSLENVSLRIALYGEAFGRLGARPWTGFGPGVVPDGNTALTVGTQVLTAEQGDVHNTYVQQLLSFGVPVGVVVSVALLTLPVWFFVRARAVPAAGVVGLALTIELVSFAFESSFEGSVLRVIFYLSVGLLAGLVRRLEADGEANAVAPAAPGRQSTR